MRKNWLLLFLATILVTIQYDANAQNQSKEKYRNKANDPVAKLPYAKKLRWADGLFRAGSYFNAIDYYQQLKQEQERNRDDDHGDLREDSVNAAAHENGYLAAAGRD